MAPFKEGQDLTIATDSLRQHVKNQKQLQRSASLCGVEQLLPVHADTRVLMERLSLKWSESWDKLLDKGHPWTAPALIETLAQMKFLLCLFKSTQDTKSELLDLLEYDVTTMVQSWLALITERDGKSSMLLQVMLKPAKIEKAVSTFEHVDH